MSNFTIGVTSRGNPKLIFNNFSFRKTADTATGDVQWRCLNKACKASLKTDKNLSRIIDFPVTHIHSPPDGNASDSINGRSCSTPNKNARLNITTVELEENVSIVNPPLDNVSLSPDPYKCNNCFALVERLLNENRALIDANSRLKIQWDAAIDRLIMNDKLIMELRDKDLVDICTQTESLDEDVLRNSTPPLDNEIISIGTQTESIGFCSIDEREIFKPQLTDSFENDNCKAQKFRNSLIDRIVQLESSLKTNIELLLDILSSLTL